MSGTLQVGNGPVGNGGLTVAWGGPETAPHLSSQVFTFNDQTQYFTVPAGVHQIQVYGSGGTGGYGAQGGLDQQDTGGGLGAMLGLTAPVNPGDRLVVEVGGKGHDASGTTGGAGGLSSGDGQNGGAGGNINLSLDGGAGGGAGGGTDGGFGAGNDGGPGGDAGSALAAGNSQLYGNGYSGGGPGGGAGGILAATGNAAGTYGSGEQPLSVLTSRLPGASRGRTYSRAAARRAGHQPVPLGGRPRAAAAGSPPAPKHRDHHRNTDAKRKLPIPRPGRRLRSAQDERHAVADDHRGAEASARAAHAEATPPPLTLAAALQ